jgi:hypothetical protein
MVSAAAVFAAAPFAPCRLPLAQLNHIGVCEHVADAYVDTLARGGRAQSAQKFRDEKGPFLLFGEATHEGSPLICGQRRLVGAIHLARSGRLALGRFAKAQTL